MMVSMTVSFILLRISLSLSEVSLVIFSVACLNSSVGLRGSPKVTFALPGRGIMLPIGRRPVDPSMATGKTASMLGFSK